ncbi:MAG TPA: hypothetical protein PKA60_01205 [Candidatus Paceibacterota bacterium]|nr:hypothetical protein [Candidatus Paceibacterota bacterium]
MSGWDSIDRAAERGPVAFILKIFFLILVAFLVIGAVTWGLKVVLYPATQVTGVYEKTLDADNAIYNYEYFKQAYQDIGAMDKKIETAKTAIETFNQSAGARENWDFRDKEEASRLTTNLTGLQNVRNDMVATYNGRARMVNRSIFMGNDVPQSID